MEIISLIYTVAYGDSECYLAEIVNGLIAEGWAPQGGVSVVVYVRPTQFGVEGDWHYYQAMVRVTRPQPPATKDPLF